MLGVVDRKHHRLQNQTWERVTRPLLWIWLCVNDRVNCDPLWNPIFLDVCEDTLPWQMCNVQEQLKHFLLREHWNITAVLSKKSDRCNLRWAPDCRWFLKPPPPPRQPVCRRQLPKQPVVSVGSLDTSSLWQLMARRGSALTRWTILNKPVAKTWWHASVL